MQVESVFLSVTVFADATDQLPSWRDTIHIDTVGPSITGPEMSQLKSAAITEALSRYAGWKNAILNPAPDPAPAMPSRDEAITKAQDALALASAALEAVQVAQEQPANVEA